MSVRISDRVWKCQQYQAAILLVLLALADYANDEGACFPRIESIATKTRLSHRQVQYAIRQLRADGVLEIEPGGGRGKPSRYKINVGALHVKGADACTVSASEKGANGDTKRVQLATKRVQITARKGANGDSAIRKNRQEPSIEPSEKTAPAQNPKWYDLRDFQKLQDNITRILNANLGNIAETQEEAERDGRMWRGDVFPMACRHSGFTTERGIEVCVIVEGAA